MNDARFPGTGIGYTRLGGGEQTARICRREVVHGECLYQEIKGHWNAIGVIQ